jgi:hypothetical protein
MLSRFFESKTIGIACAFGLNCEKNKSDKTEFLFVFPGQSSEARCCSPSPDSSDTAVLSGQLYSSSKYIESFSRAKQPYKRIAGGAILRRSELVAPKSSNRLDQMFVGHIMVFHDLINLLFELIRIFDLKALGADFRQKVKLNSMRPGPHFFGRM